ncbi:PREDICTED: probable SAL4 phosphatase isoform X1 [Camelina sativa]|uniref:3'(2'),5'-bisphosphate nucleotidase n=1 Tax=Camelina sativa TaxID=90675 RepID=A0ABM0V9E5_CAMSA|nr:PREDICTED: probable SAL4 phosphatase isoform X1 [Camelina sativa]
MTRLIKSSSSSFVYFFHVSMTYEKELAAAKKAVSLAVRLSQEVQKSLLQSNVRSKSDKSPVTAADYGSQAVISHVLERELHPEPLYLVAEENAEDLKKDGAEEFLESITKLVNNALASDDSYANSSLSVENVRKAIDHGRSQGGSSGRHWILDPVDGTRGFVKGEEYAVALALLVEGKVVLGVMACPKLENHKSASSGKVGCLFFATEGEGAYVQSLEGDSHPPEKVHVSNIENPEEATFVESSHKPIPIHSSIAKKLGIKAPPLRIHSQVKYAALARGDAEIYLRFTLKGYRENIWNHAAGAIITTEAGGVVCDADGNPLDFSKGKHLEHKTGIVVSTEKLMPRLLQAIRESIEEEIFSL